MIRIRSRTSLVCAAALMAMPLASAARADGVLRIGSERCAVYGQGFVDLGEGVCGRVTIREQEPAAAGRMRIDPGSRDGYSGVWTGGGTSNAALQSASPGMLPGISNARHLRIDNGNDPYGR